METFFNRFEEINFLKKKYGSGQAELIVFYGRRRIGKTAILNKFVNDTKGFYFIGRLESGNDVIKRFNIALSQFFNDSALFKDMLTNWDSLFDYLHKKCENSRLVVVLDEFPFIVDRFPEILSILQDKFDNKLKKSKIMLILCGSSVGMMERYALNSSSPIYGRRTGQWKVKKMRPSHIKDFLPNYAIKEVITVYSCLDTIPGYLSKFSKNKDVFENIRETMLTKGEFLYEEPDILLREELRDPSNYMSILTSIAGGLTTFNEIYNKTKLDKSMLSRYIGVLENLEMVKRINPITCGYKRQLTSRSALYVINDHFLDFWFRFVYTNQDSIERGFSEETLKEVKKKIDQYMGVKFESFIIEILPEMISLRFQKIGRWWHKDKEIDVVAINDDTNDILFAECKWQDKVDAEKVLEELKEKSKYVEWNNETRKEHFAIFAKSFKNKIFPKGKNFMLFDLKDIEKIFKKSN